MIEIDDYIYTELTDQIRMNRLIRGTTDLPGFSIWFTEANCNHWWHRDLLDDRVVQDLLSNPYFYRTSMKDDQAIKG